MTIQRIDVVKALFFFCLLVMLASLLAGCASLPGPVSNVSPVCEALIGPIRYSSTNKSSTRYAGPQLAPDLKERNQVGQKLVCPQYN
jgi:hypothetical protein